MITALLALLFLIVATINNLRADALLREKVAQAKREGRAGAAQRAHANYLLLTGWCLWLALVIGAVQLIVEVLG
jgi:heme exporter protein D